MLQSFEEVAADHAAVHRGQHFSTYYHWFNIDMLLQQRDVFDSR